MTTLSIETRIALRHMSKTARNLFSRGVTYQPMGVWAVRAVQRRGEKGYISPLEIKEGEKGWRDFLKRQEELVKKQKKALKDKSGPYYEELIRWESLGTPEEMLASNEELLAKIRKVKVITDFEGAVAPMYGPGIVNGKPVILGEKLARLVMSRDLEVRILMGDAKKGDKKALKQIVSMHDQGIRFADMPDFGKGVDVTRKALEAIQRKRQQLTKSIPERKQQFRNDMLAEIDKSMQALAKKYPDAAVDWSRYEAGGPHWWPLLSEI
jgi:hypothetical protein